MSSTLQFLIPSQPIAVATLLLIAVLFAVAVRLVFRNLSRTQSESRHLKTARACFDETQAAKATIGRFVARIEEELPDSIVRRRIALLHRVRQLHAVVGDLMARLEQVEEATSYRFVRFTASVLLVLGLLGTVVGLTLSVRGIVPAIQDAEKFSDVVFLTRAMAETMDGLQTAFSTTLAALALTFLLATCVYWGQRREDEFQQDLQEFLAFDLMPSILISSEAEASRLYVEAIETSAQDIANAANTLERSREGIQAIVDGLVQATHSTESRTVDFFNFAETFERSVGSLMSYGDELRGTYTGIQEVLKEIQENQVTHKLVGEIVDTSIARALADANEAAETVRDRFKQDIKELMGSQKEYVTAVADMSEAIRSFSENSADALAQKVGAGFDKALSRFDEGLEQAQSREQVSRMVATEALEEFRSYTAGSRTALEEVRAGLKAVTGDLAARLDDFRSLLATDRAPAESRTEKADE